MKTNHISEQLMKNAEKNDIMFLLFNIRRTSLTLFSPHDLATFSIITSSYNHFEVSFCIGRIGRQFCLSYSMSILFSIIDELGQQPMRIKSSAYSFKLPKIGKPFTKCSLAHFKLRFSSTSFLFWLLFLQDIYVSSCPALLIMTLGKLVQWVVQVFLEPLLYMEIT